MGCAAVFLRCWKTGLHRSRSILWYVAIPHNLSDFLYLNKLYMETEQHIYFFESIDTVSQACHLFSNHTLVYLYSGRLYLRNQCGETLNIERGDSAFIGRDSYSHIYAEPELHEPCRVLFFSLPGESSCASFIIHSLHPTANHRLRNSRPCTVCHPYPKRRAFSGHGCLTCGRGRKFLKRCCD